MKKHWRASSKMDPYFREVFPKPPLLAYRRQRNIKDFIIRAKIYSKHDKRKISGMKKCNKPCAMCPYISEVKVIKNKHFKWEIRDSVNCDTKNVIYLINCKKENCDMHYIGETQDLKLRFSNHKSYVMTDKFNQITGSHFNLPGHSVINMNIVILEKVKKDDINYRKERESFFIQKFKSHIYGMNRNQ